MTLSLSLVCHHKYCIRQNFRVGKFLRLCTKYTIHWKTFAVHQALASMYRTQQVIQGENFCDLLKTVKVYPLKSFAVYDSSTHETNAYNFKLITLMAFDDFAADTYLHIVFKDATIPYIVQKIKELFSLPLKIRIQTNKDEKIQYSLNILRDNIW